MSENGCTKLSLPSVGITDIYKYREKTNRDVSKKVVGSSHVRGNDAVHVALKDEEYLNVFSVSKTEWTILYAR